MKAKPARPAVPGALHGRRFSADLVRRVRRVRLFGCEVDGVLTEILRMKSIFPVTNAGVAGAILVLLFAGRLVAQPAARGDSTVPFRVPIFDRDHRVVALLNGVALVNGRRSSQ